MSSLVTWPFIKKIHCMIENIKFLKASVTFGHNRKQQTSIVFKAFHLCFKYSLLHSREQRFFQICFSKILEVVLHFTLNSRELNLQQEQLLIDMEVLQLRKRPVRWTLPLYLISWLSQLPEENQKEVKNRVTFTSGYGNKLCWSSRFCEIHEAAAWLRNVFWEY